MVETFLTSKNIYNPSKEYVKEVNDYITEYEKNNMIWELNEEQRNAVSAVLTGKDGITLIQGYAGTGKTTSIKAASNFFEKKGIKAVGLAPTGKAVQELQETGLNSTGINAFLSENTENKNGKTGIPKVYIIDEASMIGSIKLEKIIDIAKKEGSKIVLLGDKLQIPSMEQGKIFKDMQEKSNLEPVKLSTILRQKKKLYLDIIYNLIDEGKNKNKKISKAAKTLEKEKIIEVKGREFYNSERRNYFQEEAIAKDYMKKLEKGKNPVILTDEESERMPLNDIVRIKLQNAGILDKDKMIKPHDLRHSFASKLVTSGVSLATLRELLGHQTTQMTKRYSHLVPDTLKKAVDDVCGKK